MAINIETINDKLYWLNELDLDFHDDFVAIYNDVDENNFCNHVGFIIFFENELFKFHYNGSEIILEKLNSTSFENTSCCFIKMLIINREEVGVFKGHCELILNSGHNPKYGFVFGDGYYDNITGDYIFSKQSESIDIATCVGFCLKVLKGYLYNNSDYLELEDWSIDTIDEELLNYYTEYVKKYELNEEMFLRSDTMKRVFPSELLSSLFFIELPIRKIRIDEVNPLLVSIITETPQVLN